jgi:hypothetical protein
MTELHCSDFWVSLKITQALFKSSKHKNAQASLGIFVLVRDERLGHKSWENIFVTSLFSRLATPPHSAALHSGFQVSGDSEHKKNRYEPGFSYAGERRLSTLNYYSKYPLVLLLPDFREKLVKYGRNASKTVT